ncbi:MAG: ABC transporter permease [Vicinamibacterales bacterium]
MPPRLLLFHRLIVRPLVREPLRTALTVLAVALGVAVVLAIELAGNAAAGSFRASVETLVGDAEIEVAAAGGVPPETVAALASLPYALSVRPRMEGTAIVGRGGPRVPLFGLDLLAEVWSSRDEAWADASGEETGRLWAADSVWVDPSLGLRKGDEVEVLVNDSLFRCVVAGVIASGEGVARPGSSNPGAIVMDIGAADVLLGRRGRPDRILVAVPPDGSIEQWLDRLRRALPAGVEVRPRGSGIEANRRMLSAFRLNLRILSYVALVVGAFLIYNTIAVSVVRRRAEIGIVRALGARRGFVLAAFLGEGASFGLAGALLALPLGRVMASGAVGLLGSTVDSLYVTSEPGPIELGPWAILLAIAAGVGMATLSAWGPAREASRVAPVDAMARGRREYEVRVQRRRDLWVAAGLAGAGLLASRMPAIDGRPLFGYAATALLIGACAMAIPSLVHAVSLGSSTSLLRFAGVEAMLASRSLAASLRRSSVLVGALSTAIAMMVAVGIMVGSFRETVTVWLGAQLTADLYIQSAVPEGPDYHPTMAADVPERVERVAGVAGVDRFREYQVTFHGQTATFAGAEMSVLAKHGAFRFLSGRPSAEVMPRLVGTDTAIVSEPFANRHGVGPGDEITFALGGSRAAFRIEDVWYDYSTEAGFVMVDRSTLLRYLPDEAPSSLGVYLSAGASLDEVRAAVRTALADREVIVVSNRDVRTEALRVFDRTFAITYALEAIAVLVAVIGIAGALVALVIDRRREMGLMRYLGASKVQVRRMILTEAGIIGAVSSIAGLVLGFVLALVLVFVINRQSFGWTIQFHWPVAVLAGAIALVYAATVLAGLYPARIATRLEPTEVIHED